MRQERKKAFGSLSLPSHMALITRSVIEPVISSTDFHLPEKFPCLRILSQMKHMSPVNWEKAFEIKFISILSSYFLVAWTACGSLLAVQSLAPPLAYYSSGHCKI